MPVLLNLRFFARRNDFSCRYLQFVQLMESGSGGCKNRDENGTSGSGDEIAMGARDFLDQSVGPQQAQFPADSGGLAPTFARECRFGAGFSEKWRPPRICSC